MRFDNAFGLGIALVGTDAYFEPLRLTYSFGHYFNSLSVSYTHLDVYKRQR